MSAKIIGQLVAGIEAKQLVPKEGGAELSKEWIAECAMALAFGVDFKVGSMTGLRGMSMRALEKSDWFARVVKEGVGQ